MENYHRGRDRNWFYTLNNKNGKAAPLFGFYPEDLLREKLIVCFAFKGQDKDQRLYTYFDTYMDFGKHFSNLSEQYRSYYEIIMGNRHQKPHFDVDITLPEFSSEELDNLCQKVLDSLLDAILKVTTTYSISLDLGKDVHVYTSHGTIKRSFHLIINNYTHDGNEEARAFYDLVIREIPPEYKDYIDPKVYGKSQQFRTLGSCKQGSDRFKKLAETYFHHDQLITYQRCMRPHDERHRFLIDLAASLISYTPQCTYLPRFGVEQEARQFSGTSYLDHTFIEEIPKLAAEKFDFPFEIVEVKGTLIELRRLRPSWCPICDKVHDNISPFLYVKKGVLMFDCRRARDKRSYGILMLPDGVLTQDVAEAAVSIVNDLENGPVIESENSENSSAEVSPIESPSSEIIAVEEKLPSNVPPKKLEKLSQKFGPTPYVYVPPLTIDDDILNIDETPLPRKSIRNVEFNFVKEHKEIPKTVKNKDAGKLFI